jgi:hypothetical protein
MHNGMASRVQSDQVSSLPMKLTKAALAVARTEDQFIGAGGRLRFAVTRVMG